MTDTNYKAENLISGVTYQFRIQSRTNFGKSDFANVLNILCAAKPEAPSAPSTLVFHDKVIVNWSRPTTNGSPITKYTIFIK